MAVSVAWLERRQMRSLCIAAIMATPAAANPFIAEGRKPDQLIPEIVAACADNGDAVIDTNSYMVACEAFAKQTPGNAFVGSLLYGARNAQMKMTYRWTVVPHDAGSKVRLQVMFEADQGRGSFHREDRSANWAIDFKRTVAKLNLITEGDYMSKVAAERSAGAFAPAPQTPAPPEPRLPSDGPQPKP
jgi:hypothetical protein